MSYQFIGDMVRNCGYNWNYAFLFGHLHYTVKLYLSGDITREKFTADYACYELASRRFHELLEETHDVDPAMRRLVKELKVVPGPLPQAARDRVTPS